MKKLELSPQDTNTITFALQQRIINLKDLIDRAEKFNTSTSLNHAQTLMTELRQVKETLSKFETH